jgi:3'-phosphoadenosine 5'-phosphosulfate synthase
MDEFKKENLNLYNLNINKVELQWIQVLSEGWAHPLNGFMNENEYLECLHFNSLTKNGKLQHFCCFF